MAVGAQAQPTEQLYTITHAPARSLAVPFPVDAPESDTINIPIVDDFSLPSAVPNTRFWADRKVYINQRYSDNQPSIGVATFDGLDENGRAYNLLRGGSDTLADVLTSRFINLSTNNADVHLSFMYEPQGLGEGPNVADSLTLAFWSPIDNTWEQVWSVAGDGPRTFRQVILPVNNPKWLQNGFRFRFGALGSLQGAFDVWNLDYVILDRNRTQGDTNFSDPTFRRPHPPITINNYRNIPWFHYGPNRVRDNMQFVYMRRGPIQTYSINLGLFRIFQDGNQILQRTNPPVINDLGNVDVTFTVPLTDFAINPPPTDEFLLEMKTWFTGTAQGIQQNDTVFLRQPFKNYYAFDDGTAERAYGISNSPGAEMALLFNPYQPDSVKGVYLSFVEAGADTRNRGFRICIWQNDGGEPGALIYRSDSVYFPDYGYDQNDFVPYLLDNGGVFVGGGFFIGVEQTGINPLHFGFDRNSVNATSTYYSNGSFWYQSIIPGTVMLRPFFRYVPRDLSGQPVMQRTTNLDWAPFPNPTSGWVTLGGLGAERYRFSVQNFNGQVVFEGVSNTSHTYNLTHLAAGAYILQLQFEAPGTAPVFKKLMVQP